MERNLISSGGISMSQAQSFSNMCNQKAIEINNMISSLNNSSSKITIDGKEHIMDKANPIPSNIIELLVKKSKMHAFQAFLMDSIKYKNELIESIKRSKFNSNSIESIIEPEYESYKTLDEVDDEWGKLQLPESEYNELLIAETYAAHIGQFIHKGGKLDTLRKELPNIKGLSWFELETGKKTPVTITEHHTSSDLLDLHERLAVMHRKYEQRVNFFKAKIKNLVSDENSRISKLNTEEIDKKNAINESLRSQYINECNKRSEKITREISNFEVERLGKLKDAQSLTIKLDSRFQDLVDEFTKEIKE